MKIKEIHIHELIDMLNSICSKADIKANDSMEMTAQTMVELNGNITIELLNEAINNFVRGNLEIKKPYRINNLFLSELIKSNYQFRRTERTDYQEEEVIRPSDGEINEIFEQGIQVSKERVIKFMSGEDTFFSPFLLYNEYEWLQKNKGLDPNKFEDTDLHRLTGEFMSHDSRIKNKFDVPKMKESDYMKAACVALFLTNN